MKSFSSQSDADRRLYAPGAAARPRDRHTRASLGVVDLEARPCPPDPPAPVTPAALVAACGHCCQALGVPWRASIVRLSPCRAPASSPVKRA